MTKDIYAFTDDSEKVKIGTLEFSNTPKKVGGTIFYINTSATGSYIFYDSNMNPISAPQVGDDYTNCYYRASGVNKDKYYVRLNGVFRRCWGYYNITTGANATGIGGGKINSAAVLALTDTSGLTNTMWDYIRTLNANQTNGCDDWYIGTAEEQPFDIHYDAVLCSNSLEASTLTAQWCVSYDPENCQWSQLQRNFTYYTGRKVDYDTLFYPIRSF